MSAQEEKPETESQMEIVSVLSAMILDNIYLKLDNAGLIHYNPDTGEVIARDILKELEEIGLLKFNEFTGEFDKC